MSRRQGRAAGVLAAVGAACVVAVSVVAARGERVVLAVRPSATTTDPTIALPALSRSPAQTFGTGQAEPIDTLQWMNWALLGLVIVVVVVGLVALVRALMTLRVRPRVTVHEYEHDPADAAELARAAHTQLGALSQGSPRNAIVAAWVQLEDAAGRAGARRDPAETSSEYVTRVLSMWPVDAGALGSLAGLYREARFSRHELGEAAREQARADLERLHADLARVGAAQAGAAP